MARHAKSLLIMVVPTMAIGWVIVAGTFGHPIQLDASLTRGYRLPPRPPPGSLPQPCLYFLPCHLRLLDPDGPHHLRRYSRCVLHAFPHPRSFNDFSGGKFAKKHVPLALRQILSAESAANDGLAYPFLTLAIYLTLDDTRGEAVAHWVVIGWLCELSASKLSPRTFDSVWR
jgi:hypothetical protein